MRWWCRQRERAREEEEEEEVAKISDLAFSRLTSRVRANSSGLKIDSTTLRGRSRLHQIEPCNRTRELSHLGGGNVGDPHFPRFIFSSGRRTISTLHNPAAGKAKTNEKDGANSVGRFAGGDTSEAPRQVSATLQSCVNGLVCFSDDLVQQTNTLILWNPVIRRTLVLPKPNHASSSTSVYGFGYGHLGNDYKAVRVVYPIARKLSDGLNQSKPSAEIFRLSMGGSWRSLDVPESLPLLHRRQAYLNGAIHWLAHRNSIIAFDVDAELFNEMALPEDLQSTVFIGNLVIAAWKGALSVFEMTHYLGEIRLWVMGEYGVAGSWSRQLQISSLGVLRSIEGLRSNGEVLWGAIDARFHWYNPVTAEVALEEAGASKRYFCVKSDAESLVLLDQAASQDCSI